MTRLYRERLREQAQLLRRFTILERLSGAEGGRLERTLVFDQANIARDLRAHRRPGLECGGAAVADAPGVHVMGLCKCHTPAYLLGMVRKDVALVTATVGALTDDLRRVHPGDRFVAIFESPLPGRCGAQWAHSLGPHVIAMTDIRRRRWHALRVSGVQRRHGQSLGAALDDGVHFACPGAGRGGAQVSDHEARASLQPDERMLREFGAYLTDRRD
ncbi:hypothetical protein OG563_07440 [Nocardia vinacea]|uniref:Uncharacterized protein n=1 Tax=Nocardia vinacea TaxID=96468 RepID=A0ABZ1YXL6_9NOCA|nr:hypothetical protein [Nocardia vinacea]